MKKLVLFASLLTMAAGLSAMDVTEWFNKEKQANKTAEQILVDAQALVNAGTMTKEEFELVTASL